MVGRPGQWRGRDHQKTLAECKTFVPGKFFRCDKAGNLVMFPCGLQVLPDRQEIDLCRPQIVHDLKYLGLVLSEPDHDPRFGEQCWVEPLCLVEQPQGMK